MADTTNNNPWLTDFEALSRQYWNSWTELAQQSAPKPPDPTAPWRDGVAQWSKMFGGSSPHDDAVQRLSASAQSYIGLMQSMLQSGLGQSAGGGSATAWTDALRNGFNVPGMDAGLWNNPLAANLRDIAGPGARGFEQMMGDFARGAGPMRDQILGTLGMPTFGLAREHQERWQQLSAAMVEYQEQNNNYNTLLLKSSQDGFSRFQSKLAEREEPGRQLDSVRAVYDLWVDAAEEAYAQIALSEEFRKVYGAMVNAQMRVRSLMQKEVEQQSRQLGMPTRTELAGVEKAVHELRRNARSQADTDAGALAAEVATLRAELATLKQQVARMSTAPNETAKPAKPARPAAAVAVKPSKNKR